MIHFHSPSPDDLRQPILVLVAGSLGDSLLTLPALQFLQAQGPVTLAGTAPYQALGAGRLGVEEVIPLEPFLDSLHRLEKPTLSFSPSEIFVFFKQSDPTLRKNMEVFQSAKIHWPAKTFSDFLKEERWVGHYWLELVGNADPSPSSRLFLSDAEKEKGRRLCAAWGLDRPFVIHPGSGSPSKNAPLSFFRKAAEKTTAETLRSVLVLWGEAELSWKDDIQKAFSAMPRIKILPALLSLPDLAVVLSQACGYLGNDSGVTQLASACGAKTFAVFNSTDPRLWGPQESIILAAMGRNF